MRVKIRQNYGDQSVKCVKAHLKLWRLSVEQKRHLVFLDHLLHNLESRGFIFKEQKQKSSNEIHSLTIVKFWVHNSISVQNASKVIWTYTLVVGETTTNINLDCVGYLFGQTVQRLLPIKIEVSLDQSLLYLQYFYPQASSLAINPILATSQ